MKPNQGRERNEIISHIQRVTDPRRNVNMMDANDFAWHERDRAEFEYERQCPVCAECGEAITDSDEFYMVFGECVCEQCMDGMKMRVDEYIRERETA